MYIFLYINDMEGRAGALTGVAEVAVGGGHGRAERLVAQSIHVT